MYLVTTATKKLLKLKKRIRAIPGGTSAGKTIGILQVLIDKAQRDKKPTLTSVCAESFPHLKRGAMKDFLDIMQTPTRSEGTSSYFNPDLWNKTDSTYTFETRSKIEFFSLDQPHKVRGPRRQRLFINEANNIPFETYEQLEVRTDDEIWLDWNPTNEFYYYTELRGNDNVDELVLTYKDNEALHPEIVKSIESRKHRPEWWKVYGLGQLGEVEGRIYKGWKMIDEIPDEARLERYGLDLGYHPDPLALVAVYYWNGAYILDELVYQLEMSNREIGNTLKNLPGALTIADSAEPKSIAEIRMYGVNCIGAKKGPDSVRAGIRAVNDQKIFVTKRSVALWKEYNNYLWKMDSKEHLMPGQPEGVNDHCMDAIRYAINSLVIVMKKREMVINLNIPRFATGQTRKGR